LIGRNTPQAAVQASGVNRVPGFVTLRLFATRI